jgi:radical SAM superfamily enzyme YgiQ (UPF0313 family)
MKALFIQADFGDGAERSPFTQRVFPWGLATVVAAVARAGHEVEVLDIVGGHLVFSEAEEAMARAEFDVAMISGFCSANYLYVTMLAESLRRSHPDKPVVVGGLLADLHHELLLQKGAADICVLGEGEVTAVELLDHLDSPGEVAGVAFRRDGEVVRTEPRRLIRDLDGLPMPDFALWPMETYMGSLRMMANDPTTRYDDFRSRPAVDIEEFTPRMNLIAGRGCPYRCRFCSRSYQTIRLKSVDRLVSEIEHLKEAFGVRAVHFNDELLFVKKSRTLKLCRRFKELNIYWDGQARVNTVDRECLEAMKDAGCVSLGLGIESGSDRMLKAMNKGITREMALRALRDAQAAGLHVKIQLMGGYPGETKQTLAETASLIKEAGLPPRRLNWCTPLPGSELYEEVRAQGLIPDEEAYLKLIFRGYNSVDKVLLNVSGQSDQRMAELFRWVHMKMEVDYVGTLLRQGGFAPRSREFWEQVKKAAAHAGHYYLPSLMENRAFRGVLRLGYQGLRSAFLARSRRRPSSPG